MVEIPAEKLVLLSVPKIMKTNHNKPGTPMLRSRSAHHKFLEAINEWEGGERQDVKIAKYTKCDIKKRKLANGRPREDFFIQGLKRKVLEQENAIAKMKEDYKELEKRLISQTETIQFCKKAVEAEWDKRKDRLKDALMGECMKGAEQILQERIAAAVKGRREDINRIVLGIIKDKLNSLL